jgi:RNA polymerase sigma-70 factor, ECF subfamily
MVALLEASAAPAPPTPPASPMPAVEAGRTLDPRLAEEEAALKRLVLMCESGDDVSRVVVERVVPRLMAFLRYRYRSLAEDDAYDAAAEALRVAIERRAEFDPARAANVRTWLYGIAVIKAADTLRKRGSSIPLDAETEPSWAAEARANRPTTSAAGAETIRRAQQIRDALLTLPTQQRKAALARYVDGLSPGDIDRQFGWKPNTAHVYLSVARKTIRKKLGDEDE